MLKAAGAIVAVLFVSVAVVAVGMWQGFIPVPGPLLSPLADAREPEHSVRYYPPDTLAYAWATLLPSGGQHDDMRDVWQRFNDYPAFVDLVDELKRELAEDTGIEFDAEVASWVGPEISAGLLEFDIEPASPVALAMVGVRERDAAATFLAKWRGYVDQEFGAEFAESSHRGVDTWVDEDARQAYALTGDWLVYAADVDTLKATLGRIDGDDAGSLADDADFTAARATLPERRFSSFFLDYRQGLHLFEDAVGADFGPVMPGPVGPASFAEQTPDWVAGSTGWIERGVTVDVVMPTVTTLGLETVAVRGPATLLSVDTLGFVAGAFDPDVDNWRPELRAYDYEGRRENVPVGRLDR